MAGAGQPRGESPTERKLDFHGDRIRENFKASVELVRCKTNRQRKRRFFSLPPGLPGRVGRAISVMFDIGITPKSRCRSLPPLLLTSNRPTPENPASFQYNQVVAKNKVRGKLSENGVDVAVTRNQNNR